EREVVPQTANRADNGCISRQIDSDEACNSALSQRLINNVGAGQASLWSRVGLVLDHDRQGGVRWRHYQVDGAALGRNIRQRSDLAVDQRGNLVGGAWHADVSWLNRATVELDF